MGKKKRAGLIVHVQSMRGLVNRVKRGNVSIGDFYFDDLSGWYVLLIKDCGEPLEYHVSQSMFSTVKWFIDNLGEFEGAGDG